jgi:glycosyltransferase involved in cell wall biosynthesis
MKPVLSVIVPTYNAQRKKDLFEFLDSAEKQTRSDIEVIVVVEESKQLYHDLLRHLEGKGLQVKVIFSPGLRGISFSRNLGIANSSGKIIAITDDDAILSPDWAETLIETYRRYPQAIGVTGQALPLWIDESDSWFPESLYWMIGCTAFRGWNSERETNFSSGVNMSFRAEAFKFAQFPVNLGAGASAEGKLGFPNEDNDFAMKITALTQKSIIYNPDVWVQHKVYSNRLSNKYIKKYAFWQGCAEARYTDKSYSKNKRGSMRSKMLKELAVDIFASMVRETRVGFRKAKVFVLLMCFFGLGYVSYKLHRYPIFLVT